MHGTNVKIIGANNGSAKLWTKKHCDFR